jgi:hypothetical protein
MRDNRDFVDSCMAEFYNPIPDFKVWFGDEYGQRAIMFFHIDSMERDYCDPIARAFNKSDGPAEVLAYWKKLHLI